MVQPHQPPGRSRRLRAFRSSGLPASGPSGLRAFGPSGLRAFGPSGLRAFRPSGLPAFRGDTSRRACGLTTEHFGPGHNGTLTVVVNGSALIGAVPAPDPVTA
ncbi:hypothetical protein GCM10009759_20540 [Kitasatospora saccharophila]|uniref:Uncharacterized protein n=1 Tax=Kitasatospora saccharophila TaxID=407973 RepID=A0ABN2WJ51_9ACTN